MPIHSNEVEIGAIPTAVHEKKIKVGIGLLRFLCQVPSTMFEVLLSKICVTDFLKVDTL